MMPGDFFRRFAAGFLLECALLAWGLEPSTPLENYSRQAWVMENGLPQNTVQALAQTSDGFVWLGTEVGLVRFDGVGFQVFDKNSTPGLPSNDVRCLLATNDGALWIGTSEGLARWKSGSAKTFTSKDGLPGNNIHALTMQDSGVRVTTEDGEVGIKGDHVVPLAYDVLTSIDPRLQPIFATRTADGRQVQATNSEVTVFGAGKDLRWRVGHELPGTRVQALYADRGGGLWIGTNGGLALWANGKLQLLPITDPLARASILALMEDREGNIWVGTEADGLHILRDQRFRTLGAREGLGSDATTTVVEDGAGTLWVGTSGGGLNALRPRESGTASIKHLDVKNGLLSDVILSLAAGPRGELWVGTPDGLNRIRGGKIDGFTSADGLPDDFIRSLLTDTDGSVWIGTRRGLTHWSGIPGGKMETYTQASGLGSDLVGAMARDRNGDLWVATLAGLSRLHGGSTTNYTTANGLSSNVVTALLARGNGTLLIGTQDHGWDEWNGSRFTAAAGKGVDRTTIHAILDDGTNHLWFATGTGIARCDCDKTGGCSRWMELGPSDGLRSRETATNSHPSAWRASDGHLWFATPRGLVEVDPAHFPVNATPPPVVLERFVVDDGMRAAEPGLTIEAGHVHFEFDYAGLSFVAPQKVRYRYILEPFDKEWTEAGARRTAYYTNIPPGRYTFRVQAANNDGIWNTEGAALKFELRPHFYQTLWFYALLIALVVAMVVLVQRRRLRRAEREFKAVLGERNRIAREIHDTLAQGYVGISVQLEVLAELLKMSKVEAAAKHLDLTRGFVREGLADARQSIWALRSHDSGETTLPVKLRRMAEAAGSGELEASFSVYGAYRPLPPGTEQEILRVAQEAIRNVKKHAGAKKMTVQIAYRAGEIALEVRDDGKGFEKGAQVPAGHYGLTGMRERAAAIGGTLEVTSEARMGTTVRLWAAVTKVAGNE